MGSPHNHLIKEASLAEDIFKKKFDSLAYVIGPVFRFECQ